MQRSVQAKNATRSAKSRKIQQSLFDLLPKRGRKPSKPRDHFGGKYLKNYNPKSKRPMDSKKALHVVLKVSKATEKKLLEKDSRLLKSNEFEERIWDIIRINAENKGIKIYQFANAGNHLHLLIRAKQREDYSAFIRSITGLIARLVGKNERGRGLRSNLNGNNLKINNLKQKFWDGRPFSRIVSFAKKEFQIVKTYLLRNVLEAIGWMKHYPRSERLPLETRIWLNSTA